MISSPMTVSQAIQTILSDATSDELERVFEAYKTRKRFLGQVNAASVRIGTRVRLTGLSPKYLNGRDGTVTDMSGKRVGVKLDATIYARGRHYGLQSVSGIPNQCVERI